MKHVFPLLFLAILAVILGFSHAGSHHQSKLGHKKIHKESNNAKIAKQNKRHAAAHNEGKNSLKNMVGYDMLSKKQINAIVERVTAAALRSNVNLKGPFKKARKKKHPKIKKVGKVKKGKKTYHK